MANVGFAYIAWFTEDKTAEMLQPQPCKGWAMEAKVSRCFYFTGFYTTLTTYVR